MITLNLNNSELPEYSMTLPISGQTVKYRPFVVREEKVLLVALQSRSTSQINDAMRNVISACTNGKLDTRRICAADAEYAFLQIRAKSVGEEVKPLVTCSKCKKETSVKIRVDDVTIKESQKPKMDPAIQVTDNLTLIMRYPSIHDVDYDKNEIEIAFELASKCVESVILNDQVYQASDINPQELSTFMDNMLPEQFEKIMQFFQSTPELNYEFKYTCPECRELVSVELKTVSDFFR